MNIELENKLCKDFHRLFRGRYLSIQENLMSFGCECGNGWYDLIRDTCEKLKKESEEAGIDTHFSQIKEKWGLLRISILNGNDNSWDILEEAEKKSSHVCENCGTGKDAYTIDTGWIRTLCCKCFKRRGLGSKKRFWILVNELNKEQI